MNKYKIYSELNFGFAKLESGIKSFDELYKLAIDFREDINFSQVNYQLTDLRSCTFDFELSEGGKLYDLIEKYKDLDKQKIGVYLVDKPLETAYIQLFLESLKYKREYCLTTRKAHSLLGINIPFYEFEKLLDI